MIDPQENKLKIKLLPVKCKFFITSQNQAQIPLRNHSKLFGVINNLIFEMDPVLSRKIHSSSIVRPWTFSYLNFDQKLPKTKQKGHYLVKEGMSAYFYIKTIDSHIGDLLRNYVAEKSSFQIPK